MSLKMNYYGSISGVSLFLKGGHSLLLIKFFTSFSEALRNSRHVQTESTLKSDFFAHAMDRPAVSFREKIKKRKKLH